MTYQTAKTSVAFSRRAFLIAGAGVGATTLGFTRIAPAQSAGVITITFDENLASGYGVAEIIINQEPQGVLSAGCCMFLQFERGTYDLALRWPDYEVSTIFEFDGEEPVAFHLTVERSLIRLEE